GQSAGASSINTLMASPLAAGLFHRAILQSGSAYAFGGEGRLAAAEEVGSSFADALGAEDLAVLRAVPAETLLVRGQEFSFRPVVDGWLLTRPSPDAFE